MSKCQHTFGGSRCLRDDGHPGYHNAGRLSWGRDDQDDDHVCCADATDEIAELRTERDTLAKELAEVRAELAARKGYKPFCKRHDYYGLVSCPFCDRDDLRAQLDAALAEKRALQLLNDELERRPTHGQLHDALAENEQLQEKMAGRETYIEYLQSTDAADAIYERDKAQCERDGYRDQLHAAVAALRKYGAHDFGAGDQDVKTCPRFLRDNMPCSCGLQAAIDAALEAVGDPTE